MKLKKIYLEITNKCNLNCPFCIKNKRPIKSLTKEEYIYIISKIKDHTKELYLHILGEPLMHPDINYFIDYGKNNNLLINITTNGYLIDKIKNNHNIHRLNISIHSYNEKYKVDLDTYLDNIFNVVNKLKEHTFISLRLWIKDKNTKYILDYINKLYSTNIKYLEENSKINLSNNLIIDTFHEFIWPDLNNNYYNESGTCKGLIDHIGILSNGIVIPCCLDSCGNIPIGNIYEETIDNIYKKERVINMIKGFNNHKKVEELCKHCHFLDK